METPKEEHLKSSSIVDDFCKDLYHFLEESKAENKSRFLLCVLQIVMYHVVFVLIN